MLKRIDNRLIYKIKKKSKYFLYQKKMFMNNNKNTSDYKI